MMTYLVSQRTCSIGAVAVGASLLASLRVICSGAIEQILNSSATDRATHKFQEPAKPCYQPIVPQSPLNTQHNRGLFGVSFAAINPQSTVSARANRGFSAVGFEAIGDAA
ncbi:hypothetical protein [Microcoleus sp. S28C3]|uniref:hypothetical protein n=1 Tax=Microcoleus sp. S28C3 TaxID=3055414 RepID=UPI002FD41D2D